MTFDDKVIYEHCIFGSDITICFETFLEALETLEGERSVIGHRYGGISQRKADFIKAINQRGPISNQIQKPLRDLSLLLFEKKSEPDFPNEDIPAPDTQWQTFHQQEQ